MLLCLMKCHPFYTTIRRYFFGRNSAVIREREDFGMAALCTHLAHVFLHVYECFMCFPGKLTIPALKKNLTTNSSSSIWRGSKIFFMRFLENLMKQYSRWKAHYVTRKVLWLLHENCQIHHGVAFILNTNGFTIFPWGSSRSSLNFEPPHDYGGFIRPQKAFARYPHENLVKFFL